MRRPAEGRTARGQQVSRVATFPAPVGGWNARDALAEMKPEDAVALDNWYPRPSYVEFRGGSSSHATGTTGTVKTLATYNALSGTNTMYAYTSSGIYDVSSAGAVGSSKLARTNGKHQWAMFGDGSSNWMIGVNGVDKPAYFDGATWTAVDGASTPALTNLTTTDIIGVTVFKGRLLFIQKASLSFWYLAAGAAGGALTEFDLSGECPKGGYLMAIATWTRDGGSGVDDFAVFLTSEGEAIVYQGTNPSSSNTWAKVGSYSIGKPLGRRCVTQLGGDCVVLTENGAYPLSALLQSGDERTKFAISFKIQNAFNEAARSYGSVFGWKVMPYPTQDALIINVPYGEDGIHYQYVMNLTTKAWCRFTSWAAEDFGILNGQLYYASGTTVIKCWSGTADSGSNIMYYGKQAFQSFGTSQNKHVSLFMPFLSVNGSVTYSADIDVDFNDEEMALGASFSSVTTSVWDTAVWDSSSWGQGLQTVKQWSTPTEWHGRWISAKVKIESDNLTCQWMGSSLYLEPGSGL